MQIRTGSDWPGYSRCRVRIDQSQVGGAVAQGDSPRGACPGSVALGLARATNLNAEPSAGASGPPDSLPSTLAPPSPGSPSALPRASTPCGLSGFSGLNLRSSSSMLTKPLQGLPSPPVTPTQPPGERNLPCHKQVGWAGMMGVCVGARVTAGIRVHRHPDFLASACVGGKNRAAFEAEYRLGPLLGKGGFGTVFAGHRVTDRRQVSPRGGSGRVRCFDEGWWWGIGDATCSSGELANV